MMKRSLRTQMLLQYVVIVLICMLVIPAGISRLLDSQFRLFSSDRLKEDQLEAVRVLGEIYDAAGYWDVRVLAEHRGEILRWPIVRAVLFDNEGRTVTEFRRPMRHGGMRGSGIKREPGDSFPMAGHVGTELVANEFTISSGSNIIGKVRFLCLPFRESREGLFLKKFNSHMIFAIAFMLVIAVVISFFMANAISRPVLNVARMASLIGRGRYRIKDDVKSDITELEILIESMKRLGASLEAQEELRKRLMGDIAHELRNPLAIIKSHLEAFEDGVWEPTADRVRLTVGEIDRLSKLISDIERLTSIEETGSTEIKGSIDLSEEIRKIVEMYDPLYRAKSVTLSGEIAQGISLAADAGRIRQAVENLLSNSLRYTESGGKVSLTLERAGDKVVIRVIDTGMGISKDDIPYIFERFYRTDRSRARTSGGLGIGLSIVKAAVESHGGEVKAESEEGKGTIFSITLPLT